MDITLSALDLHAVVEPQLYTERAVDGTLEFSRLGGLAIGRIRSGPHRTVYQPRHDAEAQIHVVLQTCGTSVLQQRGRALNLNSDRWIVLGADEPYTIVSRVRTERIILTMGLQGLVDSVLRQIIGRAYTVRGVGRQLCSSLSHLIDDLKAIRLCDLRDLAEYLTLLVQLAMRSEIVPAVYKEPVRVEHVLDFIERHLREPELKPGYIAEHLGCSVRTLSRLMAPSEQTLMEKICCLRLNRIREELLHPVLRYPSLNELALSWGFSDYPHFCDRFRVLFGIAPTTLRRQVLAASNPSPRGNGDRQ